MIGSPPGDLDRELDQQRDSEQRRHRPEQSRGDPRDDREPPPPGADAEEVQQRRGQERTVGVRGREEHREGIGGQEPHRGGRGLGVGLELDQCREGAERDKGREGADTQAGGEQVSL